MAKSAAERKREQRERLKASNKFQSFKENETKKQKSRRTAKKKSMTIEDKEALRVKKREEMRKYRLKKSIRDASKNQSTSFDPNSIPIHHEKPLKVLCHLVKPLQKS